MPAITRADIVLHLIEAIGLTKKEAKEIVDLFFEQIICSLENNEIVKLPGFGVLKVRQKKQRHGRNPRTGQPAVISQREVVTFKPSLRLKEKIQGHGKVSSSAKN